MIEGYETTAERELSAELADVRAENELLRSIVGQLSSGAALWLHDGPGTQRVVSGAGATHLYDFELGAAEAALYDTITEGAADGS